MEKEELDDNKMCYKNGKYRVGVCVKEGEEALLAFSVWPADPF